MPPPEASARWDEASGAYAEAIRRYAESLGQDPSSDATTATIRTNTELVPRRARDLMTLLRELAGVGSIAGLRVLDLGCGWGSVSTYLALAEAPAKVVGVDSREDFLEAASACTTALGITAVEYVKADMTSLEPLDDASFDVLIANNAFPYLKTVDQLEAALAAAKRVAAPGAVLVAHHANRLQLRDPFTQAPLVHLLPMPLANGLGKLTGWRTSRDRVRVTSPGELRRRLRKAGFSQITLGLVRSTGEIRRGRHARFAHFYAIVARA